MDALGLVASLAFIVAPFAAFAAIAVRWGTDSRPGIHARRGRGG